MKDHDANPNFGSCMYKDRDFTKLDADKVAKFKTKLKFVASLRKNITPSKVRAFCDLVSPKNHSCSTSCECLNVEQECRSHFGILILRCNDHSDGQRLVDECNNGIIPSCPIDYIEADNLGKKRDDSCEESMYFASKHYRYYNVEAVNAKTYVGTGADNRPQFARIASTNEGAGVNIVILDSGIRPTHLEFGFGVQRGFSAIDEANPNNWSDNDGHGTHVASIAAGYYLGVAPQATLVAVKILDGDGDGSMTHAMEGLMWALDNVAAPRIFSMSAGGYACSRVWRFVIESIQSEQGTVFVTAASNDNEAIDDDEDCPAAAGGIVVGNANYDFTKEPDSGFGALLDIWAPGTCIQGATHAEDNTYTRMSGTSMATPLVAGAIALYFSDDETRQTQTGNQIKQSFNCAAREKMIGFADALLDGDERTTKNFLHVPDLLSCGNVVSSDVYGTDSGDWFSTGDVGAIRSISCATWDSLDTLVLRVGNQELGRMPADLVNTISLDGTHYFTRVTILTETDTEEVTGVIFYDDEDNEYTQCSGQDSATRETTDIGSSNGVALTEIFGRADYFITALGFKFTNIANIVDIDVEENNAAEENANGAEDNGGMVRRLVIAERTEQAKAAQAHRAD